MRCRKQTVQQKYTNDDDEKGLDKAVFEAIGESRHRVVNEKPAYRCLCTLARHDMRRASTVTPALLCHLRAC
jgi:hypothetical protein